MNNCSGRGVLFVFFFVFSMSACFSQKAAWKNEMDIFVREHEDSCRIHISYFSLDNSFEQYHRNANLPIPSIDAIKLPIIYEVLWQDKKKTIDLTKKVTITKEQVKQNKNAFLGDEDAGKTFTLRELVEATLVFNDNAAANILLDEVGYTKIIDRLREKDLPNIYIKDPLIDSTKNVRIGRTNFVTAADMASLMKKIQQEKKLKSKDFLFDRLREQATKAGSFEIKKGVVAGIGESTALAKGFACFVEGEKNYIVSVFVTEFQSEAYANFVIRRILEIFQEVPTDTTKIATNKP